MVETRARRARIIVAEDNDEMRRLLAITLAKDGREVVTVSTGDDLASLLATLVRDESPPDLVVSDLRMPGLDGLAVLRMLRSQGVFTPVIIITAFGSRELHDEARELGAAATLDKPFDMGVLRDAVREVLDHRKA